MSRENRLAQLMTIAWGIIRAEGSDALTLGHLAERAGVTKPVVYDHFGTRAGLLAALFRDFDARQDALMDAALDASPLTLEGRAQAMAAAYVDCVLAQGREIPGVVAALEGSPELEQIMRAFRTMFLKKCRALFLPFAPSGEIRDPALWSMMGAAQLLSYAAAIGEVTREDAIAELARAIHAMAGVRA
jgi:AcrR family transcriptional regulator